MLEISILNSEESANALFHEGVEKELEFGNPNMEYHFNAKTILWGTPALEQEGQPRE